MHKHINKEQIKVGSVLTTQCGENDEKSLIHCDNGGGDSSIFAALYNWVFLFRRCCSPGYVKLGTLEWSGTFRW